MISILMQIMFIFFFGFLIFAILFARAIRNEAKVRVLVAFALAALLCLAIAEYMFFLNVKAA